MFYKMYKKFSASGKGKNPWKRIMKILLLAKFFEFLWCIFCISESDKLG